MGRSGHIGTWAIVPSGEIRSRVLVDCGTEARDAIEDAASRLHVRLEGAVDPCG